MNKVPNSLFIDSSAWISFLIPTDSNYLKSVAIFQSFTKETRIFTSLFVIDEIITKIRRTLDQNETNKFYRQLTILEKKKAVRILAVGKAIVTQAINLLQKYPTPNTLTLTDATNIVLMKKFKISALFTFDRDFNKFKSPNLILINWSFQLNLKSNMLPRLFWRLLQGLPLQISKLDFRLTYRLLSILYEKWSFK